MVLLKFDIRASFLFVEKAYWMNVLILFAVDITVIVLFEVDYMYVENTYLL